MPYTIIKTDGTVLTDILDNSVDKISTDLTLVGKSTQNYGLEFNQNFVKLLENFASTTEPKAPITGQIWYDTSEEKIRIFNGSVFKEPNRPQIGNIEPVLSPGDLWIDSARRQLYFNDGQGTRLAGPIYTAQQGTSGYEVVDLKDNTDATKTIVKLKIGNTLLGVFSKEAFTPNYNNTAGNILLNEGISGTLIKGFTPVGTDIKFYVTAKNAENLVDPQGNPVNISNFVQTNRDNFLTGTMNISNAIPLVLGPSSNTSIKFTGSTTAVTNNVQNGNFVIQVTDPSSTNNAIFIKASQSRVGIFESTPLATLDVNGDINVRGNIVSNNSSIDIANVGVTTINIGNQTTNIAIGSTSGTTTVKSDFRALKNISADGGAITSTQTSFNMLNTGVNTINLGGEAANIYLGSNSGTTTFKNNTVVQNRLTVVGETQVDSVNTKNNIITSTGSSALSNLILSSYNGKVEFGVDAQATENLILKKKLEFDVAGEAILSNINAGGAYFRLLPVNVRNLYIGEEATLVTIGALTGTTYVNNNLNVSGNVTVGYDAITPSNIDSNSAITYLHNTNATTIHFGENATNITTGAYQAGTFYIRNASTVAEGDVVIKGGDLRTTNTSASLFNQVATSIVIGKAASNIEIGNDAGNTTLNNRLIVNGSITINGRGTNNKGTIAVGQLTSELEMFPAYLTTLTVAPTASLIYIGKPEDTDNNESGGTVNMQYDLRVVNDLIIPNVDTNAGGLGGAGLLYKNDTNRMVSSDLVRTFGSSRALGVTGDIYYSGKLTGPDSIAIIENAKITKELIISGAFPVSGTLGPGNPAVGIISSTNTTVNVFNSNVTTLNLGGAGNETINLGSNTSKIKFLGNLIPRWKSISVGVYTASAGDRLLINTGSNNVTVTLPATPAVGDEVHFIDQVGIGGSYLLLILRNGSLINAVASDLTINTAGKAFCLVFTGNTRGWVYDKA